MEKLVLDGHCADIHLFKVEIAACHDKIHEILHEVVSGAELERASRFFHVQDQKRFLVTRYMLRSVLSSFTGVSPGLIRFHQIANRKPAVYGIEFNLSHSGNLLLIAVSSCPVGIDIELIRPDFDFKAVLPASFSAEEQRRVLQAEDPLNCFYAYWTKKEAVLKASGQGLADDMSLLDAGNEQMVWDGRAYEVKTYTMENDYIFSLAGEPGFSDLLFWNY